MSEASTVMQLWKAWKRFPSFCGEVDGSGELPTNLLAAWGARPGAATHSVWSPKTVAEAEGFFGGGSIMAGQPTPPQK